MLKDPALAAAGRRKIDFAARRMPVLAAIRDEFQLARPLEGVRIGACLHVTTETANLCRALVAGGAKLSLCACCWRAPSWWWPATAGAAAGWRSGRAAWAREWWSSRSSRSRRWRP
jgi:hypothetical protein